MTTFAKSTFNAATYAAFRPQYPQVVYETVLAYHKGSKKLALDIGTGHGLVARKMSPHFERVIGMDPSAGMIAQAKSSSSEFGNISFRLGQAEDLSQIEDGSLDLVTAAQAAHWFDYGKVWPELRRCLRKGGTVAFWGYKDNVFVDHPLASSILDKYCYDQDDRYMGSYWEPGRFLLRERLQSVHPPTSDFADVTRLEYEPGTNGARTGTLGDCLMHRNLKLGEMEGYMRTFSCYHSWMQAHPDRKPKSEGGDGDVVDEMFEVMMQAEPTWGSQGSRWREKEVECEWGSYILMGRKN